MGTSWKPKWVVVAVVAVVVVVVVVSAAGCFAVVAGEVWEAEVVEKKVDVKGNGLGLGRTSERWAVRKSAAMFLRCLFLVRSRNLGASQDDWMRDCDPRMNDPERGMTVPGAP